MLASNTILQDRYRIVRLLGKGGMGAVYEAIDQRVSCVVALKETLVAPEGEARQAFQREAALLANLRHSSLPKVMDYFDEAQGDFLVMEYIPGNDLAELLALRDAPFSQEQVLRWAIELLRLLEYLHTREPPILHRDIKPANLKATKQGEIFLLDFGLAKGSAGQMATIETSKSVPGYTPVYAPLEQILGQGSDPRSDLYALGATLYHLLTGQAPVSAPARFDAVQNDRPDPLRAANQLNFQIASEIAACVQSAMALNRKDRPSSASEMRIALENTARVVGDRDSARRAEAALIETLPAVPKDDPAKPLVADKDVQFTVYAPLKIKPEKNYSVLAFAHLSKRRDDATDDEPDPIAEMKDQVARILGDQRDDYPDVKDSSGQPVPRGGELTFVPVVQGVTFSPSSRSFTWRKGVHREEFDMWASREVDGQTLNGRITVFLGSVIIAEVPLTISVDSRATPAAERISLDQAQSARRVRQVFAAYSQRDERVVAELAHVAPIFGSRFVTDRTHLEPGEDRREGLQRLIRGADAFQLFWSTNSMRSPEVISEIDYAISLGRAGFILPTYWEEPVPRSPAEGLPPQEIDRLHFYRIYPGAISQASFEAEARALQTNPKLAPVEAESFGSSSMPQVSDPTQELSPFQQTLGNISVDAMPVTGSLKMPEAEPTAKLPPLDTILTPVTPSAGSLAVGVMPGSDTSPRPHIMPSGAYSPPSQSYSPSVRGPGKKVLLPIFGVAAMVLFAAIVIPVWFMMASKSSLRENSTTSANTSNRPPLTSSNSSANANFPSAPDVQFARLDGGTLRLKDFQGRVVLLNFWTTWATPYRQEIPVLNELQKDLGPRGLSVIGISYDDTADSVRQFQKETPQDYQIGLGGKQVGIALQSGAFPTAYLIDRRGRIRKRILGGQTRAAFEAAIEPLLNEAP
jgi:serine/threonine protein kinase/peroxiredoxin